MNWKKLNPIYWFGNDDNPEPEAWYRPDSRWRKVLWYFRNPLHNFTFYVIGVADRTDRSRIGNYPASVFHPDGKGWVKCWTLLAKPKWLKLPFISYIGPKVKWYFGWRERGNFGLKLTRNK